MRKRISVLVMAVVIALTMSLGAAGAFAKITDTQVNGGGKTPNGKANGVPTVSTNPTGKAPAGQNK